MPQVHKGRGETSRFHGRRADIFEISRVAEFWQSIASVIADVFTLISFMRSVSRRIASTEEKVDAWTAAICAAIGVDAVVLPQAIYRLMPLGWRMGLAR
jgi:hypothetical protein